MSASAMDASDMALAIIAECEGHHEVGRTSIQKVAYFASVSLGKDLGHQAHLYGPYSRLLESEVGALVFAGEVSETHEPLGFTGNLGEGFQYRYALTDEGRQRYRGLQEKHPAAIARIRDVVAAVDEVAGDLSQRNLSPAAKTFYLVAKQGGVAGFSEVQELAKEYGWSLSSHQKEDILGLLTSLGLIEQTAGG